MQRREFLQTTAWAGWSVAAGTLRAEQGGAGGERPLFQGALFNGRDLSGWQVVDGPESAFTVDNGEVVITESANSPTWLRSDRRFENFDFTGEFFIKGWADSGLYFRAPMHGDPQNAGFCVKLFQKVDDPPKPESCGSIFPVVAPKLVNVRSKAADGSQGAWNTIRVRMDGVRMQVWMNGEMVQDVQLDRHPELQYRLRDGHLGIQSLSYPVRFRNFQITELPGRTAWQSLYSGPGDLAEKWSVEEGKAKWIPQGAILRADNNGHLATKEKYKNFEFQAYVRASQHSNGGVLFRAEGSGSKFHYEIQLHDVAGAVYPTGSLYGLRRAKYHATVPGEWYLFQLLVDGARCVVRIDGETVTDYDKLDHLEAGSILLQAHQQAKWIEYKQVRVRVL